MKNIKLILTEELEKDKQESLLDIINCENAIKIGIFTYSGGSVQERLNINKKIVDKINQELARRAWLISAEKQI